MIHEFHEFTPNYDLFDTSLSFFRVISCNSWKIRGYNTGRDQ